MALNVFWHDFIGYGNNINLKNITMRSLLYIIAVILVIGWAISVFAYSIGGLIHILIVIAIISLVLGLFRGPSSTTV